MLTTFALLLASFASRWGFAHRSMDQSPSQLAVSLGIGSEALAASGLDATEATAFLKNLDGATAERAALAAAVFRLDSTAASLGGLLAALDDDPDNLELRDSQAKATLEVLGAGADLKASRLAVAAAGVAGLADEKKARLSRWMMEGKPVLPAAIRIADISAADVRAVAVALCLQRRAQMLGKTVPSAPASALQSITGRSDVTDATSKLAANKLAIDGVYAGSNSK